MRSPHHSAGAISPASVFNAIFGTFISKIIDGIRFNLLFCFERNVRPKLWANSGESVEAPSPHSAGHTPGCWPAAEKPESLSLRHWPLVWAYYFDIMIPVLRSAGMHCIIHRVYDSRRTVYNVNNAPFTVQKVVQTVNVRLIPQHEPWSAACLAGASRRIKSRQ